MKQTWLLIILLTFSGVTWGQKYGSSSKKAIKQFEEARSCYERRDDLCVEEALNKAIKADPGFVEAYRMLAQLKYEQGQLEDAIKYFSTSLEIDPEGNPDGYRLLAGLTLMAGDYSKTLEVIEKFLSFPPHQVNKYGEGELIK